MPIELPPMPGRIAGLRRDERGYPVPWFVAWFDGPKRCVPGVGKPDFRVITPDRVNEAYVRCQCWICGGPLGRYKIYVIGPMCVVNRTTSEPACHRECAEFAAQACPFMIHPREKRSAKGLPEGRFLIEGHIDRNPGAVALYQTRAAQPEKVGRGTLFKLGPPERVDWYAEGRKATRAEIVESIDSGLPLLRKLCFNPADHKALDIQLAAAFTLLPAETFCQEENFRL